MTQKIIQQTVNDIVAGLAGQTYDSNTAASVTTTAQKILMPMIRNFMPTLLAQQIMGVQSMSIDTGSIFDNIIPYKVHPKYKFSRNWFIGKVNSGQGDEVHKWCSETFGNHPTNPDAWCRWYRYSRNKFYFRDERDYTWFTMRWS